MRLSLLASSLLPLLLTNSALPAFARHTRDLAFDPRAFHQEVVTCPAVNRVLNKTVDLHLRMYLKSRSVTLTGAKNRHLSIDYVDVNPSCKHTLLFLHGWPSLWASWKYQIQEFRVIHCCLETLHRLIHHFHNACLQSDYRLIVPDIRGYGASTQPGDVQSSGSIPDVVGDLLCILRHAGVSQVVVIGHVLFQTVP
jgi:soluble epoxide hydrolase/lipid-phosphate phosphatase